MKNIIILSCIAALAIIGCKKKTDELPGTEPAVISVTQIDDNSFVFKNATPSGGGSTSWDFAGFRTSLKQTDTAFFGAVGTYTISMTSNSKGGISKATTQVNVTKSSPLADFTVTPVNGNTFEVNASTSDNISYKYSYSNGEEVTEAKNSVYLPWAGNWDVILSVQGKYNGRVVTAISKQQITVTSDDLNNSALNDPIFKLLTGGLAATSGKTWLLHTQNGVGPLNPTAYDGTTELPWNKNKEVTNGPEYTNGSKLNEFTFNIRSYQFIPKNNNATIHFDAANNLFGKSQAQYADMALADINLKQAPFILKQNPNLLTPVKYSLTIGNKSYFGYNQNRNYYEIVKITPDTLYIRQPYNDVVLEDPSKDGGARYFTYLAKK